MPDKVTTSDLSQILKRVSHHLGFAVDLVAERRSGEALESVTLRMTPPGLPTLEMDVAHVATFESSTWEAPPGNLASLVGARGHTMHSKSGAVAFRAATWVDSFDAGTVAVAVARRLEQLAADAQRGGG